VAGGAMMHRHAVMPHRRSSTISSDFARDTQIMIALSYSSSSSTKSR
jgi:hypothetical protein